MRHVYRCPLRWGDMDPQGHVNNVAWIDYLQEARVDFLLRGPLAELLDSGVLVVSHQIEYLAAVVADAEPIRIELWVSQVGGARFEIAYELFHHDQLVGNARTVVVPYDLAADRLRRLTDAERATLAGRVVATEPLRPLAAGRARRTVDHPIRVRWSDLDAYGHVNNVMCYEYVQQARVAVLAQSLATPDGMWVVARQDLRYRRPIPHRLEDYLVRLGVVAAGRTSITLFSEVLDDADSASPYADATTVIVCADADGRPRPVPAELIERWLGGVTP